MDTQQLRLHELTTDISSIQNVISSIPRSHPHRAYCVQALGIDRLQRYWKLNDSDDLEQSILRFTEAIFLPLPWDRHCRNIIQIFFYIAGALVHRAYESRQVKDVTHAIIYLRYLRGQSLEVFNVPRNTATELLVDALRIRMNMKLGDVRQDVEEMAVLCHELLKSDISTTLLTGHIRSLAEAVIAQFSRFTERQEPSDEVIECLREAIVHLPDGSDSHHVLIVLAWSLFERFRGTYSNEDYEEAIAILDKVIHPPDNKLTPHGPHQEIASRLLILFAGHRAGMFGKPEYLEQAIYRYRTSLGEGSLKDTLRPKVRYELAMLRGMRFEDPGDASAMQEAYIRDLGVADRSRPSFQDLIASLTELNANNLDKHTNAIFSIDIDLISDGEVEDAIKYYRMILASSHDDSPFSNLAGLALGLLLPRAFSCTNKIEYLNEMISVFRNRSKTQPNNLHEIQRLIPALSTRFTLLGLREDFNEMMQLFPTAVDDEHARTPDRFLLSCFWVLVARKSGHPSTLAAYDSAISLMQDTLTYAPTLDIQHSRLVAMRWYYETLPLDHASFHFSNGQLTRAVEILEQGRALIWSEMRGLRTSIDQIHTIDPHLAEKFATVNRDLEMLTLTNSVDRNDDGLEGGFVRMDPLGQLMVQQRKLLDDRNKLISQIQALSGFETFLKSPSFDNLRSAASRGPVIIINHSRWRSDIIILHHNSPPSLILTPDDFYDRVSNLQDQLFGARKEGLDSNKYEEALKRVLKELYNIVGRPVIQRLKELSVPEQSRVWWCPTSVFCSLPLHAMGPIPSDDGPLRYFLDLYIPSYIPTLSTLIESNNPGSDTSDKPSILLISQPDASLPGVLGEMRVVQASSFQVATLSSATATPTAVLEHLRDHRFVHIVCHGILESGKPFDASFKLSGGRRLSSLDIVRSRFPEAEFAFLSACHTAELTEESIADEGLHLTAAMQYCGFRSVVGTMWEMADTDGWDLAENFYKRVFSERSQGVRYYAKTAKALRDAVKILRRKRGMSLERWVNFVHYGA